MELKWDFQSWGNVSLSQNDLNFSNDQINISLKFSEE